LTVQSNNDDYMPNFDPANNDVTTPPNVLTTTGTNNADKYWPGYAAGAAGPTQTPPTPVYNADGAASDQTTQDNVGVDGLININTASWKVLSMLPMAYEPPNDPNYVANHPNYVSLNENLAQQIVTYRNAHGPFTSIFDLNQVPTFQEGNGTVQVTAEGTAPNPSNPAPYPPYSGNGLLVPADPAFPNVTVANPPYPNLTEDFQGDFAVLNRISNMITTHSDTFTVYIVLEGWQNPVLTPYTAANPEATNPPPPQPLLKVTKRFAFIADRSAINGDINTRFLKTLIVPND
ncbi:MAG: helix-hairpin-helix domain-containing protein, partial [Tepidisphaeraceae bacterium]